jgi:hypothetical protein
VKNKKQKILLAIVVVIMLITLDVVSYLVARKKTQIESSRQSEFIDQNMTEAGQRILNSISASQSEDNDQAPAKPSQELQKVIHSVTAVVAVKAADKGDFQAAPVDPEIIKSISAPQKVTT